MISNRKEDMDVKVYIQRGFMHVGRGLEGRVVNKAVELLRQHLQLTLFGFDIVIDSITGNGSQSPTTPVRAKTKPCGLGQP